MSNLLKNVTAYVAVITGLMVFALMAPTMVVGLTSWNASQFTMFGSAYFTATLVLMLAAVISLGMRPAQKLPALLLGLALIAAVGPGLVSNLQGLVNPTQPVIMGILTSLLPTTVVAAVGVAACVNIAMKPNKKKG